MTDSTPTITSMKQAAIYCRVSTEAQEDNTSLNSQEAACRKFAAECGYEVAAVYRDVHSGYELWERPQLAALREEVRSNRVDAVIAYALDRLSRKQAHAAILSDECERTRIKLLFVTEEFDQSAIGEFLRNTKAFVAELEREKIRERTIRAKRARAEGGQLHNGGIDLYGYRRDKIARTRAIVELEAAIVRKVFHWYAEDCLSLGEIARRLNAEGIAPPSAGKWHYSRPDHQPSWSKSTLHVIIDNPAYKGDAFAWRRAGGSKTRPAEDWIKLHADTTPAIVSPELWQSANDRRHESRARQAAWTRNEKRPYLLRGRIVCSNCGRPMICNTETGGPGRREERRRVYRCSSHGTPQGRCGATRVPADVLEAWVWDELCTRIRDPHLIAEQIEHIRDEEPDPALVGDLAAARREIVKLTKQQERLVRRLRDTDDDAVGNLIEREIATIEEEKRHLQRMINDIESRLAVQEAQSGQLDMLADYCCQIAAKLETFEFPEKQLTLQAFNVEVRASGNLKGRNWHLHGSVPVLAVSSTTP